MRAGELIPILVAGSVMGIGGVLTLIGFLSMLARARGLTNLTMDYFDIVFLIFGPVFILLGAYVISHTSERYEVKEFK